MNHNDTPVWLITGCSTGFGHDLAQAVLARGWRAVITARDTARLEDLAKTHPETALAASLDVTNPEQIAATVAAAKSKFGTIDVLVNNAGYGYQAAIEDGEEPEIRAQFDANVFGLFALTRAVLPIMRAARRGYIMNITSVAGYVGFPGSGYYALRNMRWRVFGFAGGGGEAAWHPRHLRGAGPFRTDWAGRSLKQTKGSIAAYNDTAYARMKATAEKSGTQAGDPKRAAELMIELTQSETPPRHIVLGAFGMDAVTKKLKQELEEIEAWRSRSLQTDFPAP